MTLSLLIPHVVQVPTTAFVNFSSLMQINVSNKPVLTLAQKSISHYTRSTYLSFFICSEFGSKPLIYFTSSLKEFLFLGNDTDLQAAKKWPWRFGAPRPRLVRAGISNKRDRWKSFNSSKDHRHV